MKFVEAPYDTEVLDQSSVDASAQARAKKRMARICATPAEQDLYRYAPNRARGSVNAPGIPSDDYGEYED